MGRHGVLLAAHANSNYCYTRADGCLVSPHLSEVGAAQGLHPGPVLAVVRVQVRHSPNTQDTLRGSKEERRFFFHGPHQACMRARHACMHLCQRN